MTAAGRTGLGTNQEDVRRHNLGTVLGHVHLDGRISRSELTARMGLNRSTIGGLVTELESLGLADQAKSSGARVGAGRPSVDVVAGSRAYALAVDVRVDGLTVARVGLGGVVLARATGPIPARLEPQAVAEAVVALARIVLTDVDPDAVLVGVGVGVPGIIRASDGFVRLAPNLGWHDVDFVQILHDALGGATRPVLSNDADLGAVAEHLRGVGSGVDDLVYLSGEVGVGAGIVADGRLMQGASGFAGEVGHLPFVPDGRPCHCGARGCWETVVGGVAIAESVACPPDRIPSLGDFLDGVQTAGPQLRAVAHDLGRGLSGIVNTFNPRIIVLGGYFRSLLPLVRDDIAAAMSDTSLLATREVADIALPGLGGDSVLVGAAERAFAALLADPVGTLTCASAGAPIAV